MANFRGLLRGSKFGRGKDISRLGERDLFVNACSWNGGLAINAHKEVKEEITGKRGGVKTIYHNVFHVSIFGGSNGGATPKELLAISEEEIIQLLRTDRNVSLLDIYLKRGDE